MVNVLLFLLGLCCCHCYFIVLFFFSQYSFKISSLHYLPKSPNSIPLEKELRLGFLDSCASKFINEVILGKTFKGMKKIRWTKGKLGKHGVWESSRLTHRKLWNKNHITEVVLPRGKGDRLLDPSSICHWL